MFYGIFDISISLRVIYHRIISIWFRMVLTHIITWVYKDSLTLTYPLNHQYLAGTNIFKPISRFFDTIIDVD